MRTLLLPDGVGSKGSHFFCGVEFIRIHCDSHDR